MSKARKIEGSVASVAYIVVAGPSAVVIAGSGATLRFALLRRPLSMSWVVAVIGHHYPTHQNH
jgi:hypothetical protein